MKTLLKLLGCCAALEATAQAQYIGGFTITNQTAPQAPVIRTQGNTLYRSELVRFTDNLTNAGQRAELLDVWTNSGGLWQWVHIATNVIGPFVWHLDAYTPGRFQHWRLVIMPPPANPRVDAVVSVSTNLLDWSQVIMPVTNGVGTVPVDGTKPKLFFTLSDLLLGAEAWSY